MGLAAAGHLITPGGVAWIAGSGMTGSSRDLHENASAQIPEVNNLF